MKDEDVDEDDDDENYDERDKKEKSRVLGDRLRRLSKIIGNIKKKTFNKQKSSSRESVESNESNSLEKRRSTEREKDKGRNSISKKKDVVAKDLFSRKRENNKIYPIGSHKSSVLSEESIEILSSSEIKCEKLCERCGKALSRISQESLSNQSLTRNKNNSNNCNSNSKTVNLSRNLKNISNDGSFCVLGTRSFYLIGKRRFGSNSMQRESQRKDKRPSLQPKEQHPSSQQKEKRLSTKKKEESHIIQKRNQESSKQLSENSSIEERREHRNSIQQNKRRNSEQQNDRHPPVQQNDRRNSIRQNERRTSSTQQNERRTSSTQQNEQRASPTHQNERRSSCVQQNERRSSCVQQNERRSTSVQSNEIPNSLRRSEARPSAPNGSESLPNPLDIPFIENLFRKSLREDEDIDLGFYILGYEELHNFCRILGTIFKLVGAEIRGKLDRLKQLRENDIINYSSMKSMVIFELENNVLKSSTSAYISGCRTFNRLDRGLEFLIEFLKRVHDLDPEDPTNIAGCEAYRETLGKYHPWFQKKSAAFILNVGLPIKRVLARKAGGENLNLLNEQLPTMLLTAEEVHRRSYVYYEACDLLDIP